MAEPALDCPTGVIILNAAQVCSPYEKGAMTMGTAAVAAMAAPAAAFPAYLAPEEAAETGPYW